MRGEEEEMEGAVVEDNPDAAGVEGGVVEDDDEGDDDGGEDDGGGGTMDSENVNIKMEVPDDSGSTERCYSSLLTLASVLDAEVLLQAVGSKVGRLAQMPFEECCFIRGCWNRARNHRT